MADRDIVPDPAVVPASSDIRVSARGQSRPLAPPQHPIRRTLRAAGLAALLGLTGCGGRVTGVLTPIDAPPPDGATPVTLLAATTREAAPDNPAIMFNGERGRGLSFARLSVSIPPASARAKGDVQWPGRLPPDPAREFATLEARDASPDVAARTLAEGLSGRAKGRALVFVHGYNNRFEEAVYRFAQILHDSGAPAAPVLFTWPSRGRLFAYYYDRESANFSRDALEAVLRSLVANPRVREVDILAHSMGNWLTMESLRQIAIRDGRLPGKIRNVMLAAPDVDVDVFATQMRRIGQPRPRFTLFVSQDDRALALSRRIADGALRLGAVDPTQEPVQSMLAAENVVVLDLTEIRGVGSSNHSKFATSPEVVRFIGQRLVEGQPIESRGEGFGQKLGEAAAGAVGTLGRTAGLLIAAPVAIFDPQTRESLAEQAEDIGAEAARALGGGQAGRPLAPSTARPTAFDPARSD